MKLKNYEIENCLNNIAQALSLIENEKISGRIYYTIDKNIRILESYAKDWFNYRDDIVKEYGQEQVDENGEITGEYVFNPNEVSSETVKEFNEKIIKVAEISHPVPLKTIKSKDLYNYVVNPKFFALIDFMVEK